MNTKTDSNNNFNTEEKTSIKPQKSELEIFLSKIKRRLLKHLWLVRGMLICLAIVVVYIVFFIVSSFFTKSNVGYYFGLARDFILTPMEKIQVFENRTNILILGKGGKGHDAPDLTDTVIFASVDHEQEGVDLVSLPRDIWIPSLRAKLNSAYYWGERKESGGGGILAKSVSEEIIGKPIHYFVLIDFDGFINVVDVVGGIEVDVENAFVDERYPIAGMENADCGGDPEYKCRYETVTFDKGPQFMDGERALEFVRSRNAEGDEGTDFARAQRQQKVLQAIKAKVLSKEILLSPKKLFAIKSVIAKNTVTDMDASAVAIILRSLFAARNNILSHPIPEGYLINPPYIPKYDNLYVFIPQSGDWKNFQAWLDCVLAGKECD
jgi:LCP family protein required for cell wall assembly